MFHVVIVLVVCVFGVCATKCTFPAERDVLGGLEFLIRFFGALPSSDSCPGNVCVCNSGSNDGNLESLAVLGRAQLPESDYMSTHGVGKCTLMTKYGGVHASHSLNNTAIINVRSVPGADCTYLPETEIVSPADYTGLVVDAHTPDQCCKTCAAVASCVAATYAADTSEKELGMQSWKIQHPRTYEGFGLHLVDRPQAFTTGGISVGNLEAILDEKLDGMKTFDAWMDFSVCFQTGDLDFYIKKFLDGNVPFFAAKWSGGIVGTMYSVFVRVPKSLLIIELVASQEHAKLLVKKKLTELEQRLSLKQLTRAPKMASATGLSVVKISRAVTDVNATYNFYADSLSLPVTLTLSGPHVSTHCFAMGWGPDVCFLKRPDIQTKGHFKVSDFEQTLKASKKATGKDPRCSQNRWTDYHFDGLAPPVDRLKQMATQSELVHQCALGSLQYIYDPSGAAIQVGPLDDPELVQMLPGCSESVPLHGQIAFCEDSNCASSTKNVSFFSVSEGTQLPVQSAVPRNTDMLMGGAEMRVPTPGKHGQNKRVWAKHQSLFRDSDFAR